MAMEAIATVGANGRGIAIELERVIAGNAGDWSEHWCGGGSIIDNR